MAEEMNRTQLLQQEYNNHGTSWTRNEFFDRNGYIVIKNLCDPKELFHPVPELRGQLNYRSKNLDDFEHIEVEGQVEGSVARYWHPQYRKTHTKIRLILEQAIGRKLYNTYYYDRFYFPGQELTIHALFMPVQILKKTGRYGLKHLMSLLIVQKWSWYLKVKIDLLI